MSVIKDMTVLPDAIDPISKFLDRILVKTTPIHIRYDRSETYGGSNNPLNWILSGRHRWNSEHFTYLINQLMDRKKHHMGQIVALRYEIRRSTQKIYFEQTIERCNSRMEFIGKLVLEASYRQMRVDSLKNREKKILLCYNILKILCSCLFCWQ